MYLTFNNDIFKQQKFLFSQDLKGKLCRLFQRIKYIIIHPLQLYFLICVLPSKLIPFFLRGKIMNLEYKLDALVMLRLLKSHKKDLTNPYNYLNYKIFYSVGDIEYGSFTTSISELFEIFYKDQYFAKEFLKEESVVLDCGANIGIFSLYAHSLSSKNHIYSFEPSKRIFDILSKNVIENNLINIHPFNFAIGDRNEEVDIKISGNALGNGDTVSDSNLKDYTLVKQCPKQKVRMVTIDAFVKENNLKRVDFIKMDTEGYEKQIIKGAKETIKKFHPVISCSAYHLPEDKEEIPKLVLGIEPNYKYRLEKYAEEDFIFWY